MSAATDRFRPRFSLRTLLFAVLTLGAGVALWKNFDPWRVTREIPATLRENSRISVSPDGKWICKQSGTDYGFVVLLQTKYFSCKLYNVETGKEQELLNDVWREEAEHPYNRDSLISFSADSAMLLMGQATAKHSSLKLWDLRTNTERPLSIPSKHEVMHAEFLQGTRHILVRLRDKSTYLIDRESGTTIHSFRPDEYPIFMNGTGHYCVFHEDDDSIGVYDAATYREAHRIPASADWRYSYLPDFDGTHLYVGANWNENDLNYPPDLTLRFDLSRPGEPEMFPGHLVSISKGRSVAAFTDEEGFRLVEFPSCRELSHIACENLDMYRWIEWLDKDRLVFVSTNKTVYETRTGHPVFNVSWSSLIDCSSDYSRMIIRDLPSGSFSIYDMHTGSLLQTAPTGDIKSFDFAPDTTYFAAQTPDRIQLWYRQRPERWYGLAWLPEFWLLLFFGAAFLWSFRAR